MSRCANSRPQRLFRTAVERCSVSREPPAGRAEVLRISGGVCAHGGLSTFFHFHLPIFITSDRAFPHFHPTRVQCHELLLYLTIPASSYQPYHVQAPNHDARTAQT